MISPNDETAMENLARYIIRASFSQERMHYPDQEGKVIYTAKDGRASKTFPALEWLAATRSHNTSGSLAGQVKAAAKKPCPANHRIRRR